MGEYKGELLIVSGGLLQALGASIASIGQTLKVSRHLTNPPFKTGTVFVTLGNGVEAVGNAFLAVGHQKLLVKENGTDLIILGSWLQFTGNSVNTAAGIIELGEEALLALRLDLLGDVIQSLGAAFDSVGASFSKSAYASLISGAEMLQSIGAAIEAIGVLYILKGNRLQGERIQAIGSYILAAGTFMSAKGFLLEYTVPSSDIPLNSYRDYNKYY